MPNELGLLSKQEAKSLRDLKLIPGLTEIAGVLRQEQFVGGTAVTFNMIVHDDVFKYFKNTVGYNVFEDKQHPGLPANHTFITTIDWNL